MSNGYKGMSDHDLLVEIATTMKVGVMPRIVALEEEDDNIYGRIGGEAQALRKDINRIDDKVGKIKLWAPTWAAIGGFFGAIGAWITTSIKGT